MGMSLTPNGIAFNTQQFAAPYSVQDPSVQQGRNGAATGNGIGGLGGNSLASGLAVGSGGGAIGTTSGSVSRSGSLIDGNITSIGLNDKAGIDHSGNRVEEKDELFLYEGLRLDGDAPEFEPKAQMSTRGW